MATKNSAFNKVKSLLGKLDRDIDDARQRRLDAEGNPQAADATTPAPDRPDNTPASDADRQAPASPPNDPGRSGYGRARPINR